MKNLSNTTLKLLIALLLTLALYTSVKAHTDTEFSSPTVENVFIWTTSPPNSGEDPEAVCQSDPNAGPSYADHFSISWIDATFGLCTFWADAAETAAYRQYNITRSEENVPSCQDPFFPIPEDLNNDGEPDHCHASSCTNGDVAPVSTIQGSDCILQPDGSMCEGIGSTNDSGGVDPFSFLTGESCDCQEGIDCVEYESDESIDQQCTTYSNAGGSTTWCTADPEEHCDSNGICEEDCGFISGDFVCIDHTPPDHPEDPNIDDEPCVTNDPRPSCAGVPDGEQPNQDAKIAELLAKNNNQNKALLDKLAGIESAIKGNKAAADAVAFSEESKAQAASDDVDERVKQGLSDLANHTSNPEVATAITLLEDSLEGASLGQRISTTLIPQPSMGCANFSFNVEGKSYTSDNCEAATAVRLTLGWVFYFLLVIRALHLFKRSSETE